MNSDTEQLTCDNFVSLNGLVQYINIFNDNNAILELCFLKIEEAVLSHIGVVQIRPVSPSFTTVISCQLEELKNGNEFFLDFKNMNYVFINNYFATVNWDYVRNFNNIDEAVKYFYGAAYMVIETFISCYPNTSGNLPC